MKRRNQMKTLYLHIGAPKTGTTSIQHFCWENQEVFKKKGYCFPPMPFHYKYKSKVRNGLFLTSKYFDKDGKRDREREEENLKKGMKILEDSFLEYDNVILSDEGIWNGFFLRKGTRKKADIILESAQRCGYQIKVIVYLRRQVDYVLSWYNQLIKHSASKRLSSLSWEEYFQNYKTYIAVDYLKYIRQLERCFGKENLIVRRFDRKFFVNNSLVDDFLNAIGLQKDEDFIDDEEVTNRNSGISENACAFKRIINKIDDIEVEEKRVFESTLRKYSNDFKSSTDYSMMSAEEVMEFMEQFEASNQKIADEYFGDGLPLFEEKKHNKVKWTPNNPDYLEDAIGYMCLLHLDNIRKIKEQEEQIRILNKHVNKLSGRIKKLKHPVGWVKNKCKNVLKKENGNNQ